jgi:hypothetical protein
VPKVLENTKGLFSTNYVQGSATNIVKSSNPVTKNNTNKSNETDDDEDEANNHEFFTSKGLFCLKINEQKINIKPFFCCFFRLGFC